MSPVRLTRGGVMAALMAAAVLPARAGQGQTSPPPTQSQNPPPTQAQELDRIKAALARPTTLVLNEPQVKFYLEIRAKYPTVEEMFRGVDLINGPTRGGAVMTHNEYLSMVTPRDMYGPAGIKAGEVLQMAITNFFGQMLLRKAIQEIGEAKTEGEVRRIRERIDRELAALLGKGG
jgi:hypothetical protein